MSWRGTSRCGFHTQLEVPSLAQAPHPGLRRPPGGPLDFLLRGHVGDNVRHGLAEVKLCDVEPPQLEGLDGVRQLLLLLRRQVCGAAHSRRRQNWGVQRPYIDPTEARTTESTFCLTSSMAILMLQPRRTSFTASRTRSRSSSPMVTADRRRMGGKGAGGGGE